MKIDYTSEANRMEKAIKGIKGTKGAKRDGISGVQAREIVKAIKGDHVGIITSRMMERKYKASSEEIKAGLKAIGYYIADDEDWVEGLREETGYDRANEMIKVQDYWLKHNERAFEFVSQRAYSKYRDAENQQDVLKIHLTGVGKDDNVEIE